MSVELQIGDSVFEVQYETVDDVTPLFRVRELTVIKGADRGYYARYRDEEEEKIYIFNVSLDRYKDNLEVGPNRKVFYFSKLLFAESFMNHYWDYLKEQSDTFIQSKKEYLSKLDLSTKEFFKSIPLLKNGNQSEILQELHLMQGKFEKGILTADDASFSRAKGVLNISYSSSIRSDNFSLDVGLFSILKEYKEGEKKSLFYDNLIERDIIIFLFEDEDGADNEAVDESEYYTNKHLEHFRNLPMTEDYSIHIPFETLLQKDLYSLASPIQQRMRIFVQSSISKLELLQQNLSTPFSYANVEYLLLD